MKLGVRRGRGISIIFRARKQRTAFKEFGEGLTINCRVAVRNGIE